MMSWDQLQDNWAIVVGFVGGVLAWGRTTSTVAALSEKHKRMDERATHIEDQITSIKESAAATAASAQATQRAVELLLKQQLGP